MAAQANFDWDIESNNGHDQRQLPIGGTSTRSTPFTAQDALAAYIFIMALLSGLAVVIWILLVRGQ